MILRLVKANEATASRRRVWFDVRDASDGLTPATFESGFACQFSIAGGAFAFGPALLSPGGVFPNDSGQYYSDVYQSVVNQAPGTIIRTRYYRSGITADTPGDALLVVSFDPAADILGAVQAIYNPTGPTGYLPDVLKVAIDALGGVTGFIPDGNAIIGDALTAETGCYYEKTFTAVGLNSTGWTGFSFTIKANPAEDSDADALIAIRIANPGAAADGVAVWRRIAVAVGSAPQAYAQLIVNSITPNTQIRLRIFPAGMDIPPSPDNAPYTYELDRFNAVNLKEQIGKGAFVLNRSVRRGVAIP